MNNRLNKITVLRRSDMYVSGFFFYCQNKLFKFKCNDECEVVSFFHMYQ